MCRCASTLRVLRSRPSSGEDECELVVEMMLHVVVSDPSVCVLRSTAWHSSKVSRKEER